MASQRSMPREGHLEAVLHVFSFIRQKYISRMVFDTTYPAINLNDFREYKWNEFYGELKESITPNTTEGRGKEVYLCGFVDSDHARENKTRNSRSGVFVFFNTALIKCFSKK